ncbi:TetR/AcrR family transcriptional regulator [Sinorhizobium sp. BG8]|uniref:TetR/AcrR family transcriptional regulator n=1 Tax=Sinorhizobium sp. BG8 TaxID=2613773 RepID=UPI00193D482C|nr:TetR/AcrR family transcriptional regulator [Sinorhizobium sp. BG8]QRM53757.1 TetR/AcrR family transcriptional regulator [Sinorhizobium sp. BG8]
MSRTNKERTEATRAALIAAARTLFTDKGYADTATPDIVSAAGVTRGALYHHFEDKKALFRAVVEHEAAQVAETIEARSALAKSPREALLSGASAYFDAMEVPGRTRLILLDAPAVLGAECLGAIDRENADKSLHEGVRAQLSSSADRHQIQAISNLLSAAFDRAAIAIEAGGDRKIYEAAIVMLIDGARLQPPTTDG